MVKTGKKMGQSEENIWEIINHYYLMKNLACFRHISEDSEGS
jgi:hypothetical protein